MLNINAVGIIRLYINHSIFHYVANDTNAYEMWQKLESMYERKTAMNKASVIKRLAKLEYRDCSSVIEHLNVFQCHINQLSTMKINFEDEVQALLLLSSMPDSLNTLAVSVSNSAPNGKLMLEMVKNSMLNEEARNESHGRNENRGRGQARFQQSKDQKSGGISKSKQRKDVTCFYCGKPNHKKAIAGHTREILQREKLQTRPSKRARMVPP